ncbi:hypothetical protein J7643_10205 [bacterium]|nr:hypothetical protein [bacterium]
MIRHHALWLERSAGLLDPHRLEREIAQALGAEPLRWAIVAVEAERLLVEVAAQA